MSLKTSIYIFTNNYLTNKLYWRYLMETSMWKTLKQKDDDQADQLNQLLDEAEAVVIGIGAGMSASTGFTYVGDRFTKNFPDFIEKYGLLDMLQASLYDFESTSEYWAFQSRFVLLNYFDQPLGKAYVDLKRILEEKNLNYHIITTNADNAFDIADYDMDKVFHIQGKYGLMQCSQHCHAQTYQDEEAIREMAAKQENREIPRDLIPLCPKCGAPMEVNKRNAEKGMVEDADFHAQLDRFNAFLEGVNDKKVLFLEVGIGHTTPQFVRQPFQKEVSNNDQAVYAVMNQKKYRIPKDIRPQTVHFDKDIEDTFDEVAQLTD